MEMTGNDEEEILKRFPSYRGTKPEARRRRGIRTSIPQTHRTL